MLKRGPYGHELIWHFGINSGSYTVHSVNDIPLVSMVKYTESVVDPGFPVGGGGRRAIGGGTDL